VVIKLDARKVFAGRSGILTRDRFAVANLVVCVLVSVFVVDVLILVWIKDRHSKTD